MSEYVTKVVAEVIQRVYGDATQTALDHQAAREIIAVLREAGWASLNEVAMLIEAAGGAITVPDRIAADGRERVVYVADDYAAMGRTFRVSTRPERVTSATS